jgi:hypothetical protein
MMHGTMNLKYEVVFELPKPGNNRKMLNFTQSRHAPFAVWCLTYYVKKSRNMRWEAERRMTDKCSSEPGRM